jgi:hypothetical protein
VLPKARRFSELGVAGSDEQLPEMRGAAVSTRRVQAPELPGGGEVHELTPSAGEEAA